MNQVTLASGDLGTWSGFLEGLASFWRWAVHHPVVVLAIVAAWAIYSVWGYRWSKRQAREPAIGKATLRGTAQVLSCKQTRGMDWTSFARYGDFYGSPSRKNKPKVRYWCIVKLEVHLPGREPYVTVLRKPLNLAERAAVQRGMTVRVRVDPNDDPKNVYIDDLHGTIRSA